MVERDHFRLALRALLDLPPDAKDHSILVAIRKVFDVLAVTERELEQARAELEQEQHFGRALRGALQGLSAAKICGWFSYPLDPDLTKEQQAAELERRFTDRANN